MKIEVVNNQILLDNKVINRPGLIYDMQAGMMKIGDMSYLQDYYNISQLAYGRVNCGFMMNNLKLIELSGIDIDSVAIMYRFCLEHSANGAYIHGLFNNGQNYFETEINKMKYME